MKHRVSVTVDKDNYQVLNAAGVNISGLVNGNFQGSCRFFYAT
ncbi:type II toxin-antitoxin system CcdA family antitoxin [Brenneria roseae]|nr:type II toxin-antitoxin system CcdA family antitoxin [Brenneria roseae]